MKDSDLSRSELLAGILKSLLGQGYVQTPGPNPGAALVMHKHIDQLVLSLGVEFSRHYSDRFSGSFYLSRSYDWAYIVRGFPLEGYQRVGHFLSADERVELLDSEFCVPGVVDAWWIGFSDRSILRFVIAVETSEPRFLGQNGLFDRIVSCDGLLAHEELLREVISCVEPEQASSGDSRQRQQITSKIPLAWFKAAESVLCRRRPDAVTKKYIDLVAVGAWRIHQLS